MASKRRLRRNACTGKVRHKTQEGAVIHAGRMFRQYGDRMWAYRCKYCGGFHIGHRGF